MNMETLKRQTMSTTIEHIRISDLLETLQEQYQLTPEERFTITFEVKKIDYFDDDDVNVGDDLIEGLKEIISAKKQGIKLPNARDLLKEL